MDCFKSRYYRLNRKMLIMLGQWPYQNFADRVKLWIFYTIIIATGVLVSVERAVKADETDIDLFIEFTAEALVCIIAIIRYYTYTFQGSKIRKLLDNMQDDWQCITNENEYEILCNSADDTRRFVLNYSTLAVSGTTVFSMFMLSSPMFVYTPFFNESCPLLMLYSQAYIVDPQKYCVPLLLHICIVISLLIFGGLGTDTMYMVIVYHVVGMFKIVCYRLEHAFDNYTEGTKHPSGRSGVLENIARAVECHRNTIRFGEDIGETFQISNLVSLMLTLLCIALALYWAATTSGSAIKPALALTMCGGVMIHLFFMDLPSQKMIDHSEAVIFRAYCGMWYMARAKEQTLLLLTMQRGLKPTAMIMGKLHAATLENYAAEVQASFSYFTLLMSLQ